MNIQNAALRHVLHLTCKGRSYGHLNKSRTTYNEPVRMGGTVKNYPRRKETCHALIRVWANFTIVPDRCSTTSKGALANRSRITM